VLGTTRSCSSARSRAWRMTGARQSRLERPLVVGELDPSRVNPVDS
jgi:hypothetical protein